MLGAASIEAQSPVRQVLLLQSLDRGNLSLDHFTANFRVELDQLVGTPVNVVQVVVGSMGLVGAPERAVVDYIRSTFADGPKPDLIMTAGGPAAVFARKYRHQMFPDRPLLFASVDERFLRDPLADDETAVAVKQDYPGFIADILQLRPQTRQMFVIIGSGPLGQFWHRELEPQFKRLGDRVAFVWSDDLSYAEILRRIASLPPEAAIFFLNLPQTPRAPRTRTSERWRTFMPVRALRCLPCTALTSVVVLSADACSQLTTSLAVQPTSRPGS